MALSPRDVFNIFRGILAIVFAGMSLMFWVVNRREDALRIQAMDRLDAKDASRLPADFTPMDQLRMDLSDALRCSEDLHARGNLLVDVLNRLFALANVSVTQPFAKQSDQIDGVVELGDNRYLVDVRWDERAVGVTDIQKHLTRLTTDEEIDANIGLFVSFCGFTEQAEIEAKKACKAGDAIVLCTFADFVHVLEGEGHLDAFLSTRVQMATVDKKPYASYSE